MTINSQILLLGATGYLGGSVLVSLKKFDPQAQFKTIVKSESQADLVRAAGAEPIVGSYENHKLVTDLSAEADVVINVAEVDDGDLVNALLEGQKQRRAGGKPAGSFIQLIGINSFLDGSKNGNSNTKAKVWTDSERDIRTLAKSVHHDQMDGPLVKAAKTVDRLDVNSFIICPSVIYGAGFGPVRRDSAFFREIINEYSSRKKAFYVGKGSNVCALVHIADIVDLVNRVYKLAVEALYGPPLPNPYERYYIASAASITWKELAQYFARELHKRGLVESDDAESVSFENAGQLAPIISSNLLMQPARALALGWDPTYTTFVEGAFAEQVDLAVKALK
ncbi:hypothetical protein ACEPAH_9182 [Sanghuangporus vaninii]